MRQYRLLPHHEGSRLGAAIARRAVLWVMGMTLVLPVRGWAHPSSDSSAETPSAATKSTNSTSSGPAANAWLTAAGDNSVGVDPALGSSVDEPLLLEVYVNGHSINKIGNFVLRHGVLMAKPEELRQLGFRVPEMLQKTDLIPLSALQGFLWSLDSRTQTLKVSVSDSELIPTLLQRGETAEMSSKPGSENHHRRIESGTGVTVNYDEVGTYSAGALGGAGSLAFQAFAPFGVLSSGWLEFAGASTYGSGNFSSIRLDSAYTYSNVDRLLRYVAGDYITDGLSWTRPVHLEGMQLHTDFALRPDLITFPLPSLTGSASVPSTVTILANGNQVLASQVGSGPFQTPQLPVITGAGTISMTMTNALGQQVTVNQPFYTSGELLKPGLRQYSAEAGLARRNWGTLEEAYGKMAGAALIRQGITPKLTLEGSTEETVDEKNIGGGGVYEVGTLGVVSGDVAVSNGAGLWGSLYQVGVQHIGLNLSIGGQWINATKNYRDIAAMNGQGIARRQLSAYFSLQSKRIGSIGVAYGEVKQDAAVVQIPLNQSISLSSRILSLNADKQWGKLNFYATDFVNLADQSSSSGLEGGVTFTFGHRSSAEVGATSDGLGFTQVQQSAPDIGDWGYDAYLSAGNSPNEFGEVEYKSPYGILLAGLDIGDGATTAQMEAQGALSYVDKGLFPSNTIYDSFALVDTNPMKNVRVYQENRDVGTTGKSGKLLVPDMQSYDANLVSISPTDIPLDVTLDNDQLTVRPQDRSGVVVRFPIKVSHGALVKIVDATGKAIPVGSTVTLGTTGIMFPVGYDGDVYMKNLDTTNQITVELDKGGRCTASFVYHPVLGQIPSIGPVVCKGDKP